MKDAYWDDLGLAWTAIKPDAEAIAPRLKQRLRRQAVFTSMAIFAGLPLSLAGIALGAWTIWRGASVEAWFFVTRGVAIATISLLAGYSAWSFKSALRDDTQSVAAMVALALLRSERWLRAIRLGYLGLGIAALFGTLGDFIRTQMGKPSATPLWTLLILLGALVFALFLLQRKATNDIAKYRYLKDLLGDRS